MKKIGIMGGTFNPIHNAHLMMAQAAYEQYGLDEVWFMPSKRPPHKSPDEIISKEHRTRMVQFAIDGIEHFSFSDMELVRAGTTYTCETLAHCVEEFPDAEFFFIMGGDSLCDFEQWYHPQEIADLCKILAVPREGMPENELQQRCQELSERFSGNFLPVIMPQLTISSMQVRELLAKGKSVVGYLPEKVLRYIEIHGLYGAKCEKEKWKEKELVSYLEATLRPGRFLHTLGVAYTAGNLALCYLNEAAGKRARRAGLLHDCAKYLTDAEMIDLCDQYGIDLSEIERENPALIHGKLGAYLAKHRYGVEDEEICSAIFWHTTGKPEMTTLEKILYVADYIEPKRKMDCKPYLLSEIRKQCFRDLDQGLLMILINTVNYLQKGNKPIDDMTLQTYEYYNGKDKKNGKSSK